MATLITENEVDVLFLNDAHCLKDSLAEYQPLIKSLLPTSKLIQFPTTRVATASRGETHNRMGGALAIVSPTWKGYCKKTATDPMQTGTLNSLDLKRGPYSIRLLNVYLPPSTHSGGRATLHARTQRYLHNSTLPTETKKLPPTQFVLELLQSWISDARLAGQTVVVGGDFNNMLEGRPSSAGLVKWMRHNALQAPMQGTLHQQVDYCTHFNTAHQSTIDHIFHTPLPPNILPMAYGTINEVRFNEASDHHPIWMRLNLTSDLLPVPKSCPLPTPSRVDLDYSDEGQRRKYQ